MKNKRWFQTSNDADNNDDDEEEEDNVEDQEIKYKYRRKCITKTVAWSC